MQLQMVAPLDIGLEQHDAALDLGQDDIFDLSTTEKAMRKKRVAQLLARSNGELSEASEEASDEDDDPDSPGAGDFDSEEEKEKKIKNLEAELDEMYDAYQSGLRERDAKSKARSLRQQKEGREAWYGIQEKGSEDEDATDEESENGGWSAMEEMKEALDEDSEDSEDELVESDVQKSKKRTLPPDGSSVILKRPRLLTNLEGPTPSGRHAAKLWFSRDVFLGEGDLEVEGDDNENQEGNDSSVDSQSYMDEPANVVMSFFCHCIVLTIFYSFSRI